MPCSTRVKDTAMRNEPFDRAAKKRTVSVTLNSDLFAKAKAAGLNVSRIAEQALAHALGEAERALIKEEIRQEMEVYNAFIAEHGSPAELARAHYDEIDEAI
jgi:antitoxin CcdA